MRNRAKCRACGDVIESTHHHDFRWCKCGVIAIDGGDAYWRCIGSPENFIRLNDDDSEWEVPDLPESGCSSIKEYRIKTFLIRIPLELKKQLMILCIKRETSLQQVILNYLKSLVENET